MSEFFNNYFNIKKIMEGKREYKQQMERVKALPEDYRYVFKKIQEYMWTRATGDGMDMLQTHYDLIDLFEMSAAEGKRVLEVTGEDVAGFCEGLLAGTNTYTENKQKNMNEEIIQKLGKYTK